MKIDDELHKSRRVYQTAEYSRSTLENYKWSLNWPSGRPIKELAAMTAIDIQNFMNSREVEYISSMNETCPA